MKQLEHLPSVETGDVRPRRVLFALGIVFILLASCMAAAVGTISWTKPDRSGVLAHELRQGIRLEVDPPQNDHQIEAQAAQRLTQRGWNSPDQTSAHIPISQAMQLLVQQGWPQDASPTIAEPQDLEARP